MTINGTPQNGFFYKYMYSNVRLNFIIVYLHLEGEQASLCDARVILQKLTCLLPLVVAQLLRSNIVGSHVSYNAPLGDSCSPTEF